MIFKFDVGKELESMGNDARSARFDLGFKTGWAILVANIYSILPAGNKTNN